MANQDRWNEQNSQTFIDYARYFVPDRERQLQIMVDLMPVFDQPGTIMELCCGEGLLAEVLLEQRPLAKVYGLDGSTEMLQRAKERLARFEDRFQTELFDLTATNWRKRDEPVQAVVSSLAIHHLDGPEKQTLFRDVYRLLKDNGPFIIADLVEPAHQTGWDVAAAAWDEAVREQALALDGNTDGFLLFEQERWNMYRYFDPEDIDKPSRLFDQLKWLEQVGFTKVDVFWMRAGHAIFGGWK